MAWILLGENTAEFFDISFRRTDMLSYGHFELWYNTTHNKYVGRVPILKGPRKIHLICVLGVGDQSQVSHRRGKLCLMYEDGPNSSLCRKVGCYGWSFSDCERKSQAPCHGMKNVISWPLIFMMTGYICSFFSAARVLRETAGKW